MPLAKHPPILRGCVLAALLVSLLAGCADGEQAAEGQGPGAQLPPAPVTTVQVQPQTVQLYGDYAGRARGSRQVEVRAQVGGILEERLYVEGQVVKEGAPLFRIESAPYEIVLQRAEAELADARANFNQADREWRRISELFEQKAVSEQDRDLALSQRELAQARVASAQASVAQARLELSYTVVQAPIAGVTGLETLSEGSLIERGTLLTTVTQQDPIHVYFALPPTDAAAQRLARDAMSGRAGMPLPAELLLPDGSKYDRAGTVNFTDSTIDPATGNVSSRAVFPNPEHTVVPGQFVRVRVPLQQLENVFLIDPQAVGQAGENPRVFVIDGENTARARAVRLGPMVDGKQVVLEGLQAGDRLVVNGHVALQDGVQVALQDAGGREG